MKPFEWMVKRTPQTEWIKGRGIMLWLAFFFIELGAGTFLVASLYSNTTAMVAGWIMCGFIGGGLHLAYLGKPLRFFRIFLHPQTSWVSRGLLFVSLFLLLGLVGLLTEAAGVIVLADIFAFLAVIYGGFAMAYVNGIPLWNTALLPVLYTVSGLLGGAEVTLGFTIASGNIARGESIDQWTRALLAGFLLLVIVYLITVRYTSVTGQASVRLIMIKLSAAFWIGTVGLGMIVPTLVVSASLIGGIGSVQAWVLYAGVVCGSIGDLTMRYLILRGGLYNPLVPTYGRPQESL
ncbi:MAG: polysulfide reductase NrfD [Chloroflexi bacterium]|nr:polysulfide reductase NrfD [Chloroflexota bacterium]